MRESISSVTFCLAVLFVAVQARSPDEWKSRVIYQVLTDRFALTDSDSSSACSDLSDYCGGTFKGITRKLDYIQGLGANALWISPIPDNTDNGYHGYWQKNITLINSHFGSADDLKTLVSECHKRDIWVMLDVVANHMGNQNNGDWSNFAKFYPFNHPEHYHPYCQITNFNDQNQVEVCRLANLPDLNQSNFYVRETLKTWVRDAISNYGFDGLRIDTVVEVPKDFWAEYTQSVGVFTIGEVNNGNPTYNAGYQGALDATLNYPMYWKLRAAFQEHGSMRNIHNGVNENLAVFKDVSVLGAFLDNHDMPRFLSKNSDWTTLKNALTYIIFAEGIPIVYYGTEQGFSGSIDPGNRESLWPSYNINSDLYKFISQLANFRNQQGSALWESKQIERYVDDNCYAFTRGNVFIITTNSGNSFSVSITYHPYSNGTVLQNILDSNDKVTINGGQFTVNMNGPPKVYLPTSCSPGPESDKINNNGSQDNNPVGGSLLEPPAGVIAGVSVGAIFIVGLAITLLSYVIHRSQRYRTYRYFNI